MTSAVRLSLIPDSCPQVVVIIVIWIVSLLMIYMLFLMCLEPLLNKRIKSTAYTEHTNEDVRHS
jgi:hypothetical protein